MVLISVLLFALGVVAAWNVQRQQAGSSELIALEVHNMQSAQRLLLLLPDVRDSLNRFLRTSNPQVLQEAERLHAPIDERLEEMKDLARTEEERVVVHDIEAYCGELFDKLRTLQGDDDPDHRQSAVRELVDEDVERVMRRVGDYVDANSKVVERTNEANRHTADQMRQAFLLLGVCGGAAGLVAGLAIARAVGRSMLQLNVSVRGTADKLRDVVGPVTITSVGDFGDLHHGLREIEQHIGRVVDRLQEQELEILRQQQLAAVGQLAAGLAHELRNPLMPMKMLVQKALASQSESGLSRGQLRVIEQEIRRLESLVQEFLDFARPQPLQRRQIDLGDVVRQTTELAAPRAGAQQVRLRTSLPEAPVLLDGDPVRLQQVLLNLLLNALDAQGEPGEVAVEVDAPLRIGDGYWARLRVLDEGAGIPEAMLSRIFEPFVSTKTTGTGLGLTICRRIVREHGGELRAANRPTGGAMFELDLPLVGEPPEKPAELITLPRAVM